MPWLANILLIVPSIIAGWLVSTQSLSYWVVTFIIAMLLIAFAAAALLYIPWLEDWWRSRKR